MDMKNMNETGYDSTYIKKIVGMLEKQEEKRKKELVGCVKKKQNKCYKI